MTAIWRIFSFWFVFLLTRHVCASIIIRPNAEFEENCWAHEFVIIILVANTQDNQPTTFWFLHFQHDGTEIGTPLRQGRVHWLQARPPQPTREHRSPEGRGMWRKWRRQVVHRQEMRIRLQGKQWPKTCDVLRRDKNRFAISINYSVSQSSLQK